MRQLGQPRFRWWQWPNVLGLDAPVVAVLWQHLLGLTGKVRLASSVRLGLFLAVWAVYLADRLLDSRSPHPAGNSEPARHSFARHHARWLEVFLVLALGAAGVLAWTLKPAVRTGASLAAGGVLAYLSAVHLRRPALRMPAKEALAAILFAAGTAVAPLIRAESFHREAIAAASILAAALFYLNLIAVESHEWRIRPVHSGALRTTTHVRPNILVLSLLLTAAATATAVFSSSANRVGPLAVAVAALSLSLVEVTSDRYSVEELRVLWDVALIAPAVLLLVCF